MPKVFRSMASIPTRPPVRRGFTLIEMVAVLVIVSVLSGIAIQSYRKVEVKAKAARIATQLHYVEDAVIEALLEGAGQGDFEPPLDLGRSDMTGHVLEPHLSPAGFADLAGVDRMTVWGRPANDGFDVMIALYDVESQELEDELQAMFPRVLGQRGDNEWVLISSRDLAPRELKPPPGG